MTRSTKYVGLDVHQATTCASVRNASGQVIARTILPTEASALTEFFRGMRGAVHAAFEEGTQAQWLHDLLVPCTNRVIVCDRRGEQRRRGNKADQHDADELSHRLRTGDLHAVYHGASARLTLQELARTYVALVQDATSTMLRLKALFRARGMRTQGKRLYAPEHRDEWLAKLTDPGARFRAETLYAQLEVAGRLRPRAKARMIAEARRDPAWPVLQSIPHFGPVRVALLLATLKTPMRFRSKRALWAYAGFAVVTEASAEHDFLAGRPVRRKRQPLTRGLNQNHNRFVKHLFKSTATALVARPGPFQEFYQARLDRGMRPEMARLTVARKLAAVTLRLWKTGERYDPTKLTTGSP